ncbi:hypothetical protein M8J77_007680 [Diaphorina citri]|nr:hypothetical protein M8J77_007680 [Diaphorina citri]
MKLLISVLLCSLVSADIGQLEEGFRKHNIVPQLVSAAPKHILEIVYPNNAKVSLGNELTPISVKDEPTVTWDAELAGTYTLIMSDPDAASAKGFLHWLVVNIQGSDIHSGKVLAEYIGSGPPLGTGLHRYIFYVFKQSGYIDFTEPYSSNTSAEGRRGFSTQNFADKYKLGSPLAGNFYLAQYDDYVPILHRQFMPASPKPVTVPEYIETTTSALTTRTHDFSTDTPLPHHHEIKAAYVSEDAVVHSKVQDLPETSTATVRNDASVTTINVAPSTSNTEQTVYITPAPAYHNPSQTTLNSVPVHEIKAIYVDNDSVVHTKVDSVEHLSSEPSTVVEVTTQPIPHNDKIKAVFVDKDSIVHTKVENVEHLNDQPSTVVEVTTQPIPHDDKIKSVFVDKDSIVLTKVESAEYLNDQPSTVVEVTTQPIPHDDKIKAVFVDKDSIVHTKVESVDHLNDQPSTVVEVTTQPIPHDDKIKAVFVDKDSIVHTKVESVDHLSGEPLAESSDESLITESPIPHDGYIKAVYKLNDSVVHSKVLNEDEILHHMTMDFDTTEPAIPHDGLVRAAYIDKDSVVHSETHTEEDLKQAAAKIEDKVDSKVIAKQDVGKTAEAQQISTPSNDAPKTEHISTLSNAPESIPTPTVHDVGHTSQSTPSQSSTEHTVSPHEVHSEHSPSTPEGKVSPTVITPVHDAIEIHSVGDSSDTVTPKEEIVVIRAINTSIPSQETEHTHESVPLGGSTLSDTLAHSTIPAEHSGSTTPSYEDAKTDASTSTPPVYETHTSITIATGSVDKGEPKHDSAV